MVQRRRDLHDYRGIEYDRPQWKKPTQLTPVSAGLTLQVDFQIRRRFTTYFLIKAPISKLLIFRAPGSVCKSINGAKEETEFCHRLQRKIVRGSELKFTGVEVEDYVFIFEIFFLVKFLYLSEFAFVLESTCLLAVEVMLLSFSFLLVF